MSATGGYLEFFKTSSIVKVVLIPGRASSTVDGGGVNVLYIMYGQELRGINSLLGFLLPRIKGIGFLLVGYLLLNIMMICVMSQKDWAEDRLSCKKLVWLTCLGRNAFRSEYWLLARSCSVSFKVY
jgi:hypothetical protein